MNLVTPNSLLLFGYPTCSTVNLLTVDADMISVALNTSSVTQAIDLELILALKFYRIYGKMCFLIESFLRSKDYELPKSTSHLLSVPLSLEYVRILSYSISFFYNLNCLTDGVLCKIAIRADITTVISLWDKPSDVLQLVEIVYELKFDHKNQDCWKIFLSFISHFLILRCQDL